jgi:hypothetical protein
VLTPAEWARVDASIDRGLAYLAAQQSADGSFPTMTSGQPGVTALGVMAFLAQGHLPGDGPYGEQLNRAIDFVISCQRSDGLLSYIEPSMGIPPWLAATHAASYNHNISGLMLGEVYGQTDPARAKRVRPAIVSALSLARKLQTRPKEYTVDAGGVRYFKVIPPADRQGATPTFR